MKIIKNWWCQKVLPLVYDDSLSYYEILCKLKAKINEIIDALNDLLNIGDKIKYTKVVGRTKVYYCDYINGNDDNNGETYNTAFKTLAPIWELYNTWSDTVIFVYLCGDSVYNVGTQIRSISGNVPHFRPYNGNPTLRFNPEVGTAGPCFYDVHANISGSLDGEYKINIDSSYGGIYFENCALSLGNAIVNCSLYLIGGSAHIYSCVFTNNVNAEYASHISCLQTKYCNLSLSYCEFYNTNNVEGCRIGWASNCRIFGDTPIIFNGDYKNLITDGSFITLSCDIDKATTNNYPTIEATYSKIITENTDFYANTEIVNNFSDIQIGRSYTYRLGLAIGETITLDTVNVSGFVTGTGNLLIDIPLPRICNPSVTKIVLSFDKYNVFCYDGQIVNALPYVGNINSVTVAMNSYHARATISLVNKLTNNTNQCCNVGLTNCVITAQ